MPENYVAARDFPTVTRRFRVGDPIAEADVLDGPLPFDVLKERKWIVREGTKAGDKAAALALDPEAERAALAQEVLKSAWEKGRTEPVSGEWSIFIKDADLYGQVIREDIELIGVQVPGELDVRYYRVESLDRQNRTISGKYSADPSTLPPPPRRR